MGEGDNRGWDGWMASLTQWTWVEQAPGVGDRQGSLACCSPWGRRVRHYWATDLNWTELKTFSNKTVQTLSFNPRLNKYSRRPGLLLLKVSPGNNLDIMNTFSHSSFPPWSLASLPPSLPVFVGPWWTWELKIRVQILPYLLNFFMHQLFNPEKKWELKYLLIQMILRANNNCWYL